MYMKGMMDNTRRYSERKNNAHCDSSDENEMSGLILFLFHGLGSFIAPLHNRMTCLEQLCLEEG